MSCGSTTCSTALVFDHAQTGRRQSVSPVRWVGWAIRSHARWQQRQALLRLDDHLLADIGLTRAQAVREARKPFWK